jgi:hypothetical protein
MVMVIQAFIILFVVAERFGPQWLSKRKASLAAKLSVPSGKTSQTSKGEAA